MIVVAARRTPLGFIRGQPSYPRAGDNLIFFSSSRRVCTSSTVLCAHLLYPAPGAAGTTRYKISAFLTRTKRNTTNNIYHIKITHTHMARSRGGSSPTHARHPPSPPRAPHDAPLAPRRPAAKLCRKCSGDSKRVTSPNVHSGPSASSAASASARAKRRSCTDSPVDGRPASKLSAAVAGQPASMSMRRTRTAHGQPRAADEPQ